jgi:pyruvate kinase
MSSKQTLIATLGPSSEAESMWMAMLEAGVSAFRLNTSHLTLQQLHNYLDRLNLFFSSVDSRLPIILDLQGSKWRLGTFHPFELVAGDLINLVCASSTDYTNTLPVPHPDFFQAATESNGELSLNDGRVKLVIESIASESINARVIVGGSIVPRKGITYTSSSYRKESLSPEDQLIVEETRHIESIRYSISYVKDAAEMQKFREQFGSSIYLIAKLERASAMEEAIELAKYSDELWICRGDLGAELGMKQMAEAVYLVTESLKEIGVPVIMAGQVLEHMTEHPTPTRSELCYMHDSIKRGYKGFVLSDETAIGRYPIESCRAATIFFND